MTGWGRRRALRSVLRALLVLGLVLGVALMNHLAAHHGAGDDDHGSPGVTAVHDAEPAAGVGPDEVRPAAPSGVAPSGVVPSGVVPGGVAGLGLPVGAAGSAAGSAGHVDPAILLVGLLLGLTLAAGMVLPRALPGEGGGRTVRRPRGDRSPPDPVGARLARLQVLRV